jgi:hypothetical protein
MMMVRMMMMMRHGRDAGSVHWTWMRHINHRLHLAHKSNNIDCCQIELGHLYRLELQLRERVSNSNSTSCITLHMQDIKYLEDQQNLYHDRDHSEESYK